MEVIHRFSLLIATSQLSCSQSHVLLCRFVCCRVTKKKKKSSIYIYKCCNALCINGILYIANIYFAEAR